VVSNSPNAALALSDEGGSIHVDRIVTDARLASGFTELSQSVATRLHVVEEDA
jgi:hypothetical protein